MALADICALPVAERALPDCVLLHWAPSSKLAEAMEVLKRMALQLSHLRGIGQRGDRPRLLLPSAARTLVAGGAKLSARASTVRAGGLCHSVAPAGRIVKSPNSELFAGVAGVLLVDDAQECLCGEEVRDLLEACGATRHPQTVSFATQFTWQECQEMRRQGGCQDCTYQYPIEDFTLRGLNQLLVVLPAMGPEQINRKATLLWEALQDVEDRRGTGAFSGSYKWFYRAPLVESCW
jgi:hypothetical protein